MNIKTICLIALFFYFVLPLMSGAEHPFLPDPKLTPGAVDPHVTQANIHKTVCVAGYAAKVRNVPESLKIKVYARYGLKLSDVQRKVDGKTVNLVEVDHLISLENGGSNEIENLWPEFYEPFPGARDKDKLETALHRDLCAGKITLEEDQKILRTNWFKEYQKRFGSKRPTE